MEAIKIFDAEYKFMNIIWEHSPISSSELVNLAKEELGWKKSTTYTVIRRLCERGAIKNENAVVSALINREQVMRAETEEHINKIYEGSLRLFFTTFLKKEKLNKDEIEELKKIVEEYGEEE
ncbi:MAG TPA: BlaI/MecI/CopY family transcriptional regulator [Clostridium sp.]|jgi:predicted transcriptional regulator|nr:BlaI/MecI/CopY family transcriptional regulator [Clostridium sp.]